MKTLSYPVLFFAIAVASCFHPLRAADTKALPNFILYLTDDISADDFGCYGSRVVRTPNVDQLARDGMLFHRAYLTTSSCSPTRCSIITARYPHNTGACELHTPLPPDQYMFPQALKENGYYTVLAGKNHMGPTTKNAFDLIVGGKGPGAQENWVQLLKDRPKEKPFFCWLASYDAHRGWSFDDKAPIYDPDKIEVPRFLFNGPKTAKGTKSDSLVSVIDIGPTLLELAGVRPDPRIQGVSFTAVLQDPKAVVRDYVFAEHNWHVFQAHERMVRTGDWLYIRNAFPERLNMCVEATKNPAGSELWEQYRKGNLKPEQMDVMQKPRAAEELYNVVADPFQFTNLASEPQHAATLKRLRGILDLWAKRTCDDVPQTPTPDRSPGGKIGHQVGGVMPGIASGAPRCNDPGPILTAE